MLVDTDVLIWRLRGHPKATQRLDQLPKLTLSAITYLELLQGMRNRTEQQALQQSLALRQAERLPLTPAITERAVVLIEKLALSHSLQLGDALIAATALEHQLTVLTANTKHFSAIDGLRLERFEPGEPAPWHGAGSSANLASGKVPSTASMERSQPGTNFRHHPLDLRFRRHVRPRRPVHPW